MNNRILIVCDALSGYFKKNSHRFRERRTCGSTGGPSCLADK
jgi:hypothetical protein